MLGLNCMLGNGQQLGFQAGGVTAAAGGGPAALCVNERMLHLPSTLGLLWMACLLTV